MAAFVQHCKNATKGVGAFDCTDKNKPENNLFGNDASDCLHFDSLLADLLKNNAGTYASLSNWDATLVDAYANDLKQTDAIGSTIAERVAMYNPMYYLSNFYDG